MQETLPFEYDGKAGAIITKIAKYAFFNLVTLFIYRFWAKTHLRRYFWSSVRLDGESFAYHGTGKELFIGFVIFFCFFFVFYIVNELVLLLADGWLYLIYSVALALGFTYLFHLAVFRMLKYRLSRTSWKGVRFGLDGKGRHYAWRALVLMVLLVVSLGLAYPWVRAYLINYRLRRARFGNGGFDSSLTGGRLAMVYYISKLPWLLVLGSVAYFVFLLLRQENIYFADADSVKNIATYMAEQNSWLVGMFAVGLLGAYVFKIIYRVFEAKTALSHLQFQNIGFTNRIKILKTAGIFAVLSGLYYIFTLFAVLCVGFIIGVNYWLFPLIYVIYVVYLFVTIGLTNWIVARLIVSTRLHGDTDILQDVSSYRKDEPTHGEGLFEILDIGNI